MPSLQRFPKLAPGSTGNLSRNEDYTLGIRLKLPEREAVQTIQTPLTTNYKAKTVLPDAYPMVSNHQS